MSRIQLIRQNSENLCTSSRQRRDVCNLFGQSLIGDKLMFKDALFPLTAVVHMRTELKKITTDPVC